MKLDIHNYQLRMQRELKYLENSPISQRNKEIIRNHLMLVTTVL